jgi:hypothetical protein
VINVQCDTIAEGRRQAADHVAGRYSVRVDPVLGRVRLCWCDVKTPARDLVERALARVGKGARGLNLPCGALF